MQRMIAEAPEEFLDSRHQHEGRTLAEAFAELRRICEEENYILEIPPRQEWPNPFPDALDEFSEQLSRSHRGGGGWSRTWER